LIGHRQRRDRRQVIGTCKDVKETRERAGNCRQH
jgi:hypothetical protein